jgi:hypothetical protein
MSDWIQLIVKYKGKCAECSKEIPFGEHALWSRSSKAVKHIKCASPAPEEERGKMFEGPELDCFICGRPAKCAKCGFETECDRQAVSQACICISCLEDEQVYKNYQHAFIEKLPKGTRLKFE